ncbi:thermonuclease family protein [Bradyrhizobium sp. LHD-71]|uniref:thermonuclease family protein n=1 Tax=Bradyrhizobium sp. LHD-71 TaxID=3072141 RepID=UPI00280F3434|nr:thermonuclease family protein [Bradyrhizobium sp. LHD-71]MDQ8732804.1 thermonuclease family protein [Bradyrhizobium sp. LHD-71]
MTAAIRHRRFGTFVLVLGTYLGWNIAPLHAREAPCMAPVIGEGRVASTLDARTLRMQDGREVRLAGVEDSTSGLPAKPDQRVALERLTAGRDIVLRGSAKPDRYGRLVAFAFVQDQDTPIQAHMVDDGHLLVAAAIDDRDCARLLLAREDRARRAGRGLWAEPAAIKNTEMPGDILAGIGQFVVVEGRVQSVREAGATLYVNFGRRWTQDFAVTILRRNVAGFETAGIPLRSLERRRVRVRGWVEQRGGPRIQASWAGQIEVLGGN